MGKLNSITRARCFFKNGQSNTDGQALDSALSAGEKDPVTNSHVYYKDTYTSTDDGDWETLEYNINNVHLNTRTTPLYSPESTALHADELFLAQQYIDDTGNDFWMIKLGIGDSFVHDDGGGTTWNSDNAASAAIRFVDWYVKVALQKLVETGYYPEAIRVFWFQGYTDCDTTAHADAYEGNLQFKVLKHIKQGFADLGLGEVVVTIQESPDWVTSGARTNPAYSTLIGTQATIGAKTGYEFLANTDYKDDFKADNININDAGFRKIAPQQLNLIKDLTPTFPTPTSDVVPVDKSTRTVYLFGLQSETISFKITTSAADNDMLMVRIAHNGTISSLTYGGQALSLQETINNGTTFVHIYILLNPPKGTNDLFIDMGVNSKSISLIAQSFINVNQTTPLGTAIKTTGFSDTVDTVSPVQTEGGLVVDAIGTGIGTFVRDGLPIEDYINFASFIAGGFSSKERQLAGSENFKYTKGLTTWAQILVEIKKA